VFLKDLSEFSLQSLRVFSYVVSMGSVVEAAEALGLTQPAVSLQIHNLEKQLGFTLFERQGRKNVLTSRGEDFFRKVLPQLEILEQVLIDSRESAHGQPELRLGSVEGIGEYWIWSRVKSFMGKTKDMRFKLEIQESDTLEQHLLTGRLSLIVTPKKIEHPQIISQVLMDERLFPVGRKKVIAALRDALENKSEDHVWEKATWIGYGDTISAESWAQRWLENVGFVIDRRFRYFHKANSYSVIKQLLLDGAGVCVAPEHTCEDELKSGGLVGFESKRFPALTNRLYISHRERSLNKTHQDFKDWLLANAPATSTHGSPRVLI
jgi:DNA-binding transcriptional LysR family regulator